MPTSEDWKYAEDAQKAGTWIGQGKYARGQSKFEADPLFSNLTKGEALQKRQQDFGLGSNNNTETQAMLDEASATGNNYSSAFNDLAGSNLQRSEDAQNRGLGAFRGDTSAYHQGLDNAAADRGMQTGSYGALMNFANQGPGPSAAQAQLTQATDANTRNALALARSGRGMGSSQAALRSAMDQNAVTQQTSAAQMAELRANENTAYQAQRLNALNATGGLASQIAGTDQGYAQQGLAGAQYQSDTALKGTQLNDASAQNWATQQGNALQQGLGAEMGAQTQKLNVNSTALTGRENEYASANSTNATEKGLAQSAAIADANRTQAYTGAALSTAGTVIGALSDERSKQNINPLGVPTTGPAAPKDGSVAGSIGGPSLADQEKVKDEEKGQMGQTAGKVAGAAIGGYFGGPIGGVAGSFLGGLAGKTIGKALSDIRSKDNIQPLSTRGAAYEPDEGGGSGYNFGQGFRNLAAESPDAEHWPGWAPNPNNPSERVNPYAAIDAASHSADRPAKTAAQLLSGQSAAAVADSPKAVEAYANAEPDVVSGADRPAKAATEDKGPDLAKVFGKGAASAGSSLQGRGAANADAAAQRFAKSDHPILSEGDALLANSARAVPGATYEYKDPKEPGAKPGKQVGPMAQDLAANPLTRGTVVKTPGGKLGVDTPRLTLYNTAQQHAQQNQTDALDARIADLEKMLKRKPGDEKATSFQTSTGGL